MIKRIIQEAILADFSRKKVIVLMGARQVGKTTLLSGLHMAHDRVLTLNCDNLDDSLLLEERTATELSNLFSGYDIAFIDEAQRVKNIGLTLKNDWGFETQHTSGFDGFLVIGHGQRD